MDTPVKGINNITETVKDDLVVTLKKGGKVSIAVCKLIDVSEEKPSSGYPDYYNNSMWRPNSWYLITELMRVDKDILNKLVVLSTGKRCLIQLTVL